MVICSDNTNSRRKPLSEKGSTTSARLYNYNLEPSHQKKFVTHPSIESQQEKTIINQTILTSK